MNDMKTLMKKFLIVYLIPTFVIHELLHFIPAYLFDRNPELKMNIDFKNAHSHPMVNYSFSGRKYKEIIITCSPVLGILVPIILAFITLNPYVIGLAIYQLINLRWSFLSPLDFKVLKYSLNLIDSLRSEAMSSEL